MPERRRDRFCRIVLPGLRFESDDAAALLNDRHAGKTVQRAAGAQVIDGETDRLWRGTNAELSRNPDNRGGFEKGAGHAAVNGGQHRVADDFWRERHDEGVVLADADAKTAGERAVDEHAGRILR